MWSTLRPIAANNGIRFRIAAANDKPLMAACRLAVSTSTSMCRVAPLSTRLRVRGVGRVSRIAVTQQQQLVRRFTAASVNAASTATKPKAVKKTTAAAAKTKKAAAAKKTTTKAKAKKPAAKKAAKKAAPKKKAVLKKKKVAKKAAPKKKPKKVLTPEEKKKVQVRELKKVALLKPPTQLPQHPWILYVYENTKGVKREADDGTSLAASTTALSRSFKELPSSEVERLRETTSRNRETNAAAYKAWVESHDVVSIANANRARRRLTRLLGKRLGPIVDERQPKRAVSAFSLFTKTRWSSGDFEGKPLGETAKTLGAEWKALDASQRQAYETQAKADADRYEKQIMAAFGRSVKSASPSGSE